VETPNEWDVGTKLRRAIYRPFPQAVPITYYIDKYDRAPCVQTCPAGTNVQGYVALIKLGKYKEAVQLMMEKLPFPGSLGRVCPAPCEKVCRRVEVDSAVSIRDLKRFAADQVKPGDLPVPAIDDREEKVAVIGSGPAGLTVAYYMRLKGYQVTVFEALNKLGGMLRVGIPDYRLPQEVLDAEIDYLLKHGIKVRTGISFGTDLTMADLRAEGFGAVFLGIGAHASLRINIPGEDATANILDAVSLLRDVNLGREEPPGDKVIVIGGGNVAIDAARVIKRLGSREVTVVYRRTEKEMPAYAEEIEGAREEGIDIQYLTSPMVIEILEGKLIGCTCIRNELGPPDASGRRRPVPIKGSELFIPCDCVVPAIGQKVIADWIADEPGLELTRRNTFRVDPLTMQTGIPDLFAAGDAVTGPATVIEAVSAGHKAVTAMHAFLNQKELDFGAVQIDAAESPEPNWKPIPEGTLRADRVVSLQLDIDQRTRTFDEVDCSFSEQDAQMEAARCVDCGGCCECKLCVAACEAKAIDHTMPDAMEEIEVGSIIVATGFDPLDPSPMRQYGYGKLANVFTNLEFERLSNATGPTSGRLLKRDPRNRLVFTDPPKSVAILHCIGSRDINFHEYCSRTCCMYALKYAHLLKDKCGHDTVIYNFYIDMRCFGKGYEEFYRRVQSEGVRMIRGKAARVEEGEDGLLTVTAEDTLSNSMVKVPVEMVILCTAMEPRADANLVSRTFGVGIGSDGFFQEQHPKLEPVSTASSGVFLAGACQGPKDIPDTVAQAKGAAAEALALSASGHVAVSPMISHIDENICIGCQVCIGLCPYSAIEFDSRKGVSIVNEAVCKGCGSCSGHCPSGAAAVRHFTDKQIFAEIEGLLAGEVA
jgi:heterodisulfide reductase subunit A